MVSGGSPSATKRSRPAERRASSDSSSTMNSGDRRAPTRAMSSSGSTNQPRRLVRSSTSCRVKNPALDAVRYGTPWLSNACSYRWTLDKRRRRIAASEGLAGLVCLVSLSQTAVFRSSSDLTSAATALASTLRRSLPAAFSPSGLASETG